jgi:hypothetical protein
MVWRRYLEGACIGAGFGGTLCGLATFAALVLWSRFMHPMTEAARDDLEFLVVFATPVSMAIGTVFGLIGGVVSVWLYRQWQPEGPASTHARADRSRSDALVKRRKQAAGWAYRALIGAVLLCGSMGGSKALGEPPDPSQGPPPPEVQRREQYRWLVETPGWFGFLLLTSGLFEGGTVLLARRRSGRGGD